MPYWFWDPKRNPNVENHPDGVDLGIWAWGRAHGDYHLELGLGRGGGSGSGVYRLGVSIATTVSTPAPRSPEGSGASDQRRLS